MLRSSLAIAALLTIGIVSFLATRREPPTTPQSVSSAPLSNPADAAATTPAANPPPPATPHSEPSDQPQQASSVRIQDFRPGTPPDSSIPEQQLTIALPDGSRVPVLNDAFGAPDMLGSWPADRPWSPILYVETDSFGKQWYVHADESRSQTLIAQVVRSGKSTFQPMTVVYTPAEGDILRPGEGAAANGDAPPEAPAAGSRAGASRKD